MSDVAPAEQDQPINADEAPETLPDQPTGGDEESFTDSYNPSELPDDVRPHVEAAYKQLQSAYTSKTQSLAEERREAERAQQALDALRNPQVAPAVLAQLGYTEEQVLEMFGYQPEEDDDPDEYADPDERIERLEQTIARREQADQQARQEEAVTNYISEQIEEMEREAGREFDAKEHQALDVLARQNPTPQGYPDVKGAYELLNGLYDQRQKQWIESKKTPRPPGGGKPGSRTVDLSKETPEERQARMLHAAEQAEASRQ